MHLEENHGDLLIEERDQSVNLFHTRVNVIAWVHDVIGDGEGDSAMPLAIRRVHSASRIGQLVKFLLGHFWAHCVINSSWL